MDFALAKVVDDENTDAHDLKLVNGDLVFVEDAEAIAQQLRIRFHFFRGEWFLDARQGIPYLENVLVKNPSRKLLNAIFAQVIETTPGIEKVLTFEYNLESNRELTFTFTARLESGGIIGTTFQPFILES